MSHPLIQEMRNPTRFPAVDLYEGELIEPERLLYPASTEHASESQDGLLERLSALTSAGGHIAIVDGAFDVPHDNHTWYLRETRRVAAAKHFGRAFTEASVATQRSMVASDELTLIVTLDADAKVAAKKGFNPEKGNVARPVYTWQARANRIGGLMIPNSNGTYRPILDIVSVEGDPAHQGTMFESHLDFGRTLAKEDLLHTWVIFDEHGATVDAARAYIGDPDGIISIVPQDQANFAIDPRTGTPWTSSAIISRITGNTAT